MSDTDAKRDQHDEDVDSSSERSSSKDSSTDASTTREGPASGRADDAKSPTPDATTTAAEKATDADTLGAAPREGGASDDDDADGTQSDSAKPESSGGEPTSPTPEKDEEKRDKWFWHWVVGIIAVLCVELYIYGHNGKIEVCVGVEGVTDWSLIGKPKTPDNFAKSPKCAQRMNLGMYGDSEEAARAALDEACARATTTNHVARTDCVRRDKKWTRKVFKEHIPPWDERLYKRLLWLE